MTLLVIGIVLCVLPILTWFSGEGFVPIAGTTLFFWVIGIPMILVGADRITPGGIWKSNKRSKDEGTEYRRIYHYSSKGKERGYTEIPKK